jgi:aminobenzoyl-glutamate utilization protein B
VEKRRAEIAQLVDDRKDIFIDMSHQIWGFAEPRFQEYKSSELQQKVMEELGFKNTVGLAGEETAFIAEWGSGKPVIAILGEFDALSGLSQEADCDVHTPVAGMDQGHGCGHNILGAASASAAAAVKEYMEKHNLPGTIRYYGCPAEENAGGKAFLVRDGFFDDCDIAICWHPNQFNMVSAGGSLANFRVFYTFHGTSAHAAGAPHLGRSALDAVEIMNVGVNYMREHMISDARVHYAVIDTGGTAPNVVQSRAQVLYAIRAPKVTEVQELKRRIDNIAKGAALITETTVEIKQVSAYSNTISNAVIEKQLGAHLSAFVPVEYTDEEMEYARKFTKVITDLDRKNMPELLKKVLPNKEDFNKWNGAAIYNFVAPTTVLGRGSTDVGDVSWVVPTAQISTATWAPGTAGHSWQATAQAKGPVADKGLVVAAKTMACAAMDFMTDPELVAAARAQWIEDLDGETYPNPLPKGYMPEIW